MVRNIIVRHETRVVRVGDVKIGGNNPIVIQSMAKSDTVDIKSVVKEVKLLEASGCEIIRVAVKDQDAARAIKNIKKGIKIPLVADIHFSPELAIMAIENGADKIRLNPGNIKDKASLGKIIKLAKKRSIPIRIGVNSGSVDRSLSRRHDETESFVKSLKGYLAIFESLGFYDIILSSKSSDVLGTIDAYRKVSKFTDYPLHLGITASGPKEEGVIKSSVGIGALLADGIGDTIRVSLTGPSIDEVYTAKSILKALKLRNFGPEILSCPTCGRTKVNLVKIVNEFNNKLKNNSKFNKLNIKIAIMGCVVNGPGEAKEADLGIAAGIGKGVIFKKGKQIKVVKENEFVNSLFKELENL